ncbi:cell division topological specificity factor MinE [Acetomicrobium sp. S15 = DSM 107314]|uniref:cell division topological specificity factor MinE n=1 Tax=Acetomicrobium sp. S15 = DSM 107314 TaxID=2529858 RepID=UPI0018E1C929|nr:cell division topological specificity factor MinE [Acetomicrobium sp. S15 = DSM 107314]
MPFWEKFFRRKGSKDVAKERLQLVLIHDRADISPDVLEKLRKDLIQTIGKYLDIDDKRIELEIEREDRSVALVANIPLMGVKRQLKTLSPEQ